MEQFVHLHVHSQYSLLDGQASIAKLVDKAISDGMPGIALTDHGVMFGIKEFYNYVNKKNSKTQGEIKGLSKELKALEEAGTNTERIAELREKIESLKQRLFKPILGCEGYCARRSRLNKDANVPDPYKPNRSIDNSGWHIVLLAKNLKGYHNLLKLVSASWVEGYYYRPRIDKELLEKYHEGIIVSSACLGGELPQHIMHNNLEAAEETIQWFKNLFGEDYYIELQRHKTNNPNGNAEIYEEQVRVNAVLIELARKHGVKLIATNDIHFVNEDDAEAHDRLVCLSTSKEIDDPKRMRYSKQEWMKTTAEMNTIFADLPEAIANTKEILDKVEFYSIDNDPLMPDFAIPEGFKDDDDYLRHLTYLGAEKKYGDSLTNEIRERIDFELDTIKMMGFPGYFLIVQDFIAAARSMGVFVGPGRGSAAGSAVAYCLGITDIDPIKYDLLFERFLNPDRISMPDIDIDFDDDGRSDVLRWVTEKYGKERVAHIITYGTMATKSAIKDVARVHRLPLAESDRLAKLVPDKIKEDKKVNLEKAIEAVPELKKASLSPNPLLRDTMKYALALEGNVRNTGVHACGIIIGKTDISDVVPISTATDKTTGEEMLVTQYEGSVIEETGLIKMDFLGLKTLSILKEALLNIKKRHGIAIDIDKIPLDDKNTYQLYSEGRTIGTFQFESTGMQRYLKELKPTEFEDLIAMNALYRPGPMSYIPDFISRKHGKTPITYDLPCMERYLKDTYGVTVYQEQVMLLSREIAGFTRGESDNLRKAMGKKLVDKMAALKDKFIAGGVANGHPEKVLHKVWGDWEAFASYAFNKSHATCYSWVAYQTAYLKANYPAEYMAGVLSRNLNNSSEITKLMDECRTMGIRVLVPDVNESDYKFSVNHEGNIRFGLTAIKGVGASAVDAIIREREEQGEFKDIFDFFERIDMSVCNKKSLESLVYSGAFDSLGISRMAFMADTASGRDENFLGVLMRYSNSVRSEQQTQGASLFGDDEEAMQIPRPTIPAIEEAYTLDLFNKERDLVGHYLSGNPLNPYRVILEHYCTVDTVWLKENLERSEAGQTISFGGLVTKGFHGKTKKGTDFGKITIEDMRGSFELALFSNNYIKYANYIKEGLYLLIQGTMQERPFQAGVSELVIDRIDLLDTIYEQVVNHIELTIPIENLSSTLVEDLQAELQNNPGKSMLSIRVVDNSSGTEVNFLHDGQNIGATTTLLEYCERNDIGFSIKK